MIRKDKEEEYLAVTGGFLEVRPDKVIVLADACERADEIDTLRAEEAKKRAQETMKAAPLTPDAAAAEAAFYLVGTIDEAVEKAQKMRG